MANLKIYLNPSANGALAADKITSTVANGGYNGEGIIVFDEAAKLIYVDGVKYGLTDTQASNITTALNTANTLNGDDSGKSVRTISGEVLAAALNDTTYSLIGSGENQYDTVSEAIQAALTAAANAATAATNAQTAADGKIANVTGYKSGTTADDLIVVEVDANHVANVKSSTTLTTAVTAATNALPKGTSTYADAKALETGIIGNTTNSEGANYHGTSSSTTVLNPNDNDNNTWLQGEEQTLSHLKDLINVITGGSSVDLASIQSTIAAIENELKVADEATINYASTILDAYKTLRGSGNLTVNSETQTTLQGIIDALEGLISAADTKAGKHSVVTDGVAGDATAGQTNYAVVTSSTVDGQTTYTVQTTDALDTVASNASSALSIANAALPKGTSSYADAAALETALKGNSSTDTSASTTIEGAKKYADSVASTAAGAVVSWETIPSA